MSVCPVHRWSVFDWKAVLCQMFLSRIRLISRNLTLKLIWRLWAIVFVQFYSGVITLALKHCLGKCSLLRRVWWNAMLVHWQIGDEATSVVSGSSRLEELASAITEDSLEHQPGLGAAHSLSCGTGELSHSVNNRCWCRCYVAIAAQQKVGGESSAAAVATAQLFYLSCRWLDYSQPQRRLHLLLLLLIHRLSAAARSLSLSVQFH